MSTILTDVEGFTPVIDVVVQDVGLMAAVVYGRVWRYCQMDDRICRASLEKIANQIGVSRKTVERHIKELCEKGYLIDKTPDRRNAPHVYADSGKLIINGLISIKHGETESLTNDDGKTESPTRSDRESYLGKTESLMKIVFKKEEDTNGVGEKEDYLEMVLKGKKDNTLPERPRGYGEASEGEYKVCQRVADLWTGGKLPWAADDIERHLTAANKIIELHGGDVRAAVRTIDEYHLEHGDDFNVTGPWSLRGVLPGFKEKNAKPDVIKIGVT